MLRSMLKGLHWTIARVPVTKCTTRQVLNTRPFSIIQYQNHNQPTLVNLKQNLSQAKSLLNNEAVINIANNMQTRSVTKFSLQKGKRKTVKAVLKRFYRLDWGGWIRTRSGRHKKLWRKSAALKRRLRQHVLVNSTQSWLLDKMVTNYWKRPKYYVDDPYEPYHQREEFFITRKKSSK